jgi:hypothetical protein
VNEPNVGPVVVVILAASLLAGCTSASSNGGAATDAATVTEGGLDADRSDAGGQSGPCDPLAPPPTSLGAILGVGQDTQSTLYVADEAPDSGGENRVFVSSGTTLDRQHVAGSGGSGGPPNADYTFSFQPPFTDAGALQALLVQMRGGAVTAMALGPGDSPKTFLGGGPGQVPLTVLDGGAVAGLTIQNLPSVVQYVIDVSTGEVIVITQPMDAWGYSGFRLFYGTPGNMIERPITSYDQAMSGPADISFTVGSATYTLHTTYVVSGPDAGPLGGPGPATLDMDSGTLQAMPRLPTPTSLSGFTFTCSSAAGG